MIEDNKNSWLYILSVFISQAVITEIKRWSPCHRDQTTVSMALAKNFESLFFGFKSLNHLNDDRTKFVNYIEKNCIGLQSTQCCRL